MFYPFRTALHSRFELNIQRNTAWVTPEQTMSSARICCGNVSLHIYAASWFSILKSDSSGMAWDGGRQIILHLLRWHDVDRTVK